MKKEERFVKNRLGSLTLRFPNTAWGGRDGKTEYGSRMPFGFIGLWRTFRVTGLLLSYGTKVLFTLYTCETKVSVD